MRSRPGSPRYSVDYHVNRDEGRERCGLWTAQWPAPEAITMGAESYRKKAFTKEIRGALGSYAAVFSADFVKRLVLSAIYLSQTHNYGRSGFIYKKNDTDANTEPEAYQKALGEKHQELIKINCKNEHRTNIILVPVGSRIRR